MSRQIELQPEIETDEAPTLLPLTTEEGATLTLQDLRAAAAKLLPGHLSLRYTDSDGDVVTINSDADLKELLGYMQDEQLERVQVVATSLEPPAAKRAASAVQTQLRGLVTAMSKLTAKPQTKPSPANAMNLLVATLESLDVAEDADELQTIQKELLTVLQDEEFRKAVEELSASEEFKELADVMVTAIYEEDAQVIEETTTARFDELLVFAQRVLARCPTLKPVLVSVAKSCMSGLVRYNDNELADDGSSSSSSSSSSSNSSEEEETAEVGVDVAEVPVHLGVICDGCEKAPLVGVRYKSLEVPDFDLCEECEASGKWSSHEPFIKITDPTRAPKQKRTSELVHPFVTCDGCEMSPIVGIRFKSKTAVDFDLCEACEASGEWSDTHGPFTKIQEPGMMHALKFTCRRGGKSGHHGKFGHRYDKCGHHGHHGKCGHHGHHGKYGHHGHHGMYGHHGKFGRHGPHHGSPGKFHFNGPPLHHFSDQHFTHPHDERGPPRHESPTGFPGHGPQRHHEGPGFPGHGPPPHHEGPPGFPGRGPPPHHEETPGFPGHGPPPGFGRRGWHHGPRGFGPPGCFGRFGPPPFGFPGPHCRPEFERPVPFSPPQFDPRDYEFRGHHGRHGRLTRFSGDDEEHDEEGGCHRKRHGRHHGRGRCGRGASDLEVRFLEDVTIEDGTVVEAGKPLRKMWKLVNDGERSWPDGCYMVSQRGNPMFTDDNDSSSIELPALAPGEEFIAGVDLIAPTVPGRYTSYWRVCDPADVSFGHRFWIDIVVVGDSAPDTASSADTVDSAQDTEMKGAPEAVPLAESDEDIEIIEVAEMQEADEEGEIGEADNAEKDGKPFYFKESIKALESMGFTDSERNLRALELADGNIGAAVNVLLSE